MESYGEIEEVKGVQLRAVELLYVTLRLPTMRKKKKTPVKMIMTVSGQK